MLWKQITQSIIFKKDKLAAKFIESRCYDITLTFV